MGSGENSNSDQWGWGNSIRVSADWGKQHLGSGGTAFGSVGSGEQHSGSVKSGGTVFGSVGTAFGSVGSGEEHLGDRMESGETACRSVGSGECAHTHI